MKKRARRADGQATREAILAAAEAEFAKHGYAAASVRSICRRANANIALANRYFGPKENLYRIIAKRLFGDLGAPMAELAKSVTDAASWRNAVRTWVDDFLFMTLPTATAQRRCAALFRQEVIHPRRFDFVKHDGYDAPTTAALPGNGVIVLEGIHALNPRLTADVDDACKFRLFIEPKTQPEVFATTRLPVADARLLRRVVRDNQFRKMDPLMTFVMWPKVLAGEAKWINPFRPNADAEFDSALPYELAVLKHYVQGQLEKVVRRNPDEIKAQVLLELLQAVHATDPTKVPGDSILRETIGGSQLDY